MCQVSVTWFTPPQNYGEGHQAIQSCCSTKDGQGHCQGPCQSTERLLQQLCKHQPRASGQSAHHQRGACCRTGALLLAMSATNHILLVIVHVCCLAGHPHTASSLASAPSSVLVWVCSSQCITGRAIFTTHTHTHTYCIAHNSTPEAVVVAPSSESLASGPPSPPVENSPTVAASTPPADVEENLEAATLAASMDQGLPTLEEPPAAPVAHAPPKVVYIRMTLAKRRRVGSSKVKAIRETQQSWR